MIRTDWGEDINGRSQQGMKEPAEEVVHTTKNSSVMDYLLITEGKGELNERGGRQALPECSDQA